MYKYYVHFRSSLLVYLTHKLALPVLKLVRKPEIFPYSRHQLKNFAEGSLGKALIDMLDENDLELLTHYAKHDMKHILLGYPTTDKGEVCLQAFMLGNGHLSFPVIITVVFGACFMPEHWLSFLEAFKKGRQSAAIADWKWCEIVHDQTNMLKKKIANHKKNNL
jgi:hypothetical protein